MAIPADSAAGTLHRLRHHLNRPIDGASIAAFRIGFGVIGVMVVARLLAYGWWERLYLDPLYLLPYPGFAWLPRPDRTGLLALLSLIALSAGAIAAGSRLRLASLVFFLSFGWLELLDQATYLNHYVWLSAAALLLALLPIGGSAATPVPAWTLLALRAQVGLVYVFAGIAKLNADWLLRAQPLRIWLADHGDLPGLGALLAQPWVAWPASWAAAAFDLTVVGFLCWRRTRAWAFAAVVVFHLFTRWLFPIGVFPWVMVLGATLFFPPDWPRRLRSRLELVVGVATTAARRSERASVQLTHSPRARALPSVLVAALLAVEVLLPLRRFVLPGDAHWNEEGYRLSYLVMANEKSGLLRYQVRDMRSGERFVVLPGDLFSRLQVERMAHQPRLITAGARRVAEHFAALGRPAVEVRADSFVAHNGRAAARLIDPTVDLARALPPRAAWILPARAAPSP